MTKMFKKLINSISRKKVQILGLSCILIAMLSLYGSAVISSDFLILIFALTSIMAVICFFLDFIKEMDGELISYKDFCRERIDKIFKDKTKVEVEFVTSSNESNEISCSEIYLDMLNHIKSNFKEEIKIFAIYDKNNFDSSLDIELYIKDKEELKMYKNLPIYKFFQLFKVVK